MSKQTNPIRTCTDCFHCHACHLWSNGAISNTVAAKCPQFEPVRYASLKELQDLYKMQKGDIVPVVRCGECEFIDACKEAGHYNGKKGFCSKGRHKAEKEG